MEVIAQRRTRRIDVPEDLVLLDNLGFKSLQVKRVVL